ncbi:MAG: flagellar motor protein [Acidobacteria bacterium]|nr:flagellar motor protein [Acidobacteriota bacterium]
MQKQKADFGTIGGLLLATAGILGGYLLEHGKPQGLIGESAALIVLGGCLGATLVANPPSLVLRALTRARGLLMEAADDKEQLIEALVGFATRARKNGIVSLEQEASELEDPFLRKSLMLAVDGMDLQEIRSVLELAMDAEEARGEAEAKVLDCAGGFAPTIGIIGAVLGLIIVMGDLKDMEKVGTGIAAAFVATIYGVGTANLVFLPMAHKIRLRAAMQHERQELILEGICGLVEGMNPKMIRLKLQAYLPPEPVKQKAPVAQERQRPAA